MCGNVAHGIRKCIWITSKKAVVKEMWMKQAIGLQLTASNPLTSQLKLAAPIPKSSPVLRGRPAASSIGVGLWRRRKWFRAGVGDNMMVMIAPVHLPARTASFLILTHDNCNPKFPGHFET